jgi:large subunit ribosomal protein L1
MTKLSKKKQKIRELIQPNQQYSVNDAVKILVEFASKKFNESIDISVNLGVDPKKSDQVVRSSTLMPEGTGKQVRVAAFVQGDDVAKAKEAGADAVGYEDLADQIKGGDCNFDVVITTPNCMAVVGKLGNFLGPRGLMPNPKVGTVTTDVVKTIKEVKSGQVRYRTDKNGIIHCTVGKMDFSAERILKNITALLMDLRKAKPSSAKGVYFKKISLSSTMGPGIPIDISSLPV